MSGRWKQVREFRKEFRREIQWTVLVVVLAGLVVVALWPRSQTGQDSDSSAGSSDSPAHTPSQTVDPALRASAQLPPCPSGPANTPGLAGATGSCLADGAPANLGSVTGGQPTLINLWASWCGPCRAELPALEQYSKQPGAIRVVGVQGMSDSADGLDLLRSLGVHLPTLHDDDSRIHQALRGPNTWPASFVVLPSGEVRAVDPPVIFRSPEQVRATVQHVMGASG